MAMAMLLAVPRASWLLRRCRSEGMTGAGRLTDLGGEKGGPSDDDGGGGQAVGGGDDDAHTKVLHPP